LLIRGILAVLFGIMAFALPGLTLVTLVLLYGFYALADGLTALWVGGSSRALSLFTDFENFTVFKPASYHEMSLHQMLDQVIAWGGALKALRNQGS
jgi:hypothetical protein